MFTDDRLRILKNIELKQTAQIVWSHSEFEALLARLESAEKVIESVIEIHPTVYQDNLIEVWRHAAGKDAPNLLLTK